MTDERRRRTGVDYTKYSVGDDAAQRPREPRMPEPLVATQRQSPPARPPQPRPRKSVAAGRLVAAGIGLAAMAGLVANMEMAGTRAEAAKAAAAGTAAAQKGTKGAAPVRYAAAKVKKKRPIVLTPHTVVHTVSAPAPSGGGYVASAPAAAPVASTGGS
jgi:hypothetical protein